MAPTKVLGYVRSMSCGPPRNVDPSSYQAPNYLHKGLTRLEGAMRAGPIVIPWATNTKTIVFVGYFLKSFVQNAGNLQTRWFWLPMVTERYNFVGNIRASFPDLRRFCYVVLSRE